MTRWLVTGASGLLGQELTWLLRSGGADVIAPRAGELDVTDRDATLDLVATARPDVVVNCAAWTAVDDAEAHEALALAVNGHGAAHVAAACARSGSRLVQMSTDYVFSGTATAPYAEDDPPAPGSAYGRTKLAGERAVRQLLPAASYVLRTAWLYGAHGPNFVTAMMGHAAGQDTVHVVDDQYGQPTWAQDLARQAIRLADAAPPPGIYHATAAGATTWLGLARTVFRLLDADPARVIPISSAELGRPAPRPGYSVLGHARWVAAGLPALPDWRDSLRVAFPALMAAGSQHQPA